MDLRISKLLYHNAAFPRHNDVFALACRIYAFLAPFRMSSCSVREAHDLAVGDQRILRDNLARVIVTLCNLVRQASRWIADTLKKAARSKTARSDSRLGGHLVDFLRPRRSEEPSSECGSFKRATFPATSDSDSS